MKKGKTFKTGDKVFAKVKGYPPWPALVQSESGKKYVVKFYGTGEIGNIKSEDLFYFIKSKSQLTKVLKRKDYNDALEEIEKAVAEEGGDGDTSVDDVTEITSTNGSADVDKGSETKKGKRKRSMSDTNASGHKKINISSESSPKGTDEQKSPKTGKKQDSKEKLDLEEAEASGNEDQTTDANLSLDETVIEAESSPSDNAFLENTDLISEKSLKYNILYADHVRSDEQYYKDQPPEIPLLNYTKTVLPVKLSNGKFAGIKLSTTTPKFTSEYERAMFDEEVSKKVLKYKEELASGNKDLEEDLLSDISLSEEDIQRIFNDNDLKVKLNRVARIKDEAKLVELDDNIKLCLGLETADPVKALEHLEEMLKLKHIDSIMLLKHSHVLEVIKRLRIYVGNTKEWNLSEESLVTFKNNAQKVREKAEEVYRSFKAQFPLTKDKEFKNFWERFTDSLAKFREDCKTLPEAEVCVLCADPKSRATFMNQLEEKEIAEAQEAQNENSKETEKENSSGMANSENVTDVQESEQDVS